MYFDGVAKFDFVSSIKNLKNILAHTSEGRVAEKLLEHSNLTLDYLNFIIKEKKLDKILQNIENSIIKSKNKETSSFFRELFYNAVYMHDVGKINKVFQKDKMGNILFKDVNHPNANHSMLSAIIYFDFYYEKLQDLDVDDDDYNTLLYLIALNSYLISKHHGYLKAFHEFLTEFEENVNLIFEDKEFVSLYKEFYTKDPFIDLSQDTKIVSEELPIFMKGYKTKNEFEINYFIYARFLFSCITSADFYATYDYMNESKITSMGVLSDVNEIYDGFKDGAIYKSMTEHKKYLAGLIEKSPFEEGNINLLRTEMCIEAEANLIKNIDDFIFFLEAPTGSGKTITSINLALTILSMCKDINKYVYGFPFNTLVEQTNSSLLGEFKSVKDIESYISILNSTTPIKTILKDNGASSTDEDELLSFPANIALSKDDIDYEKSLLNKQFVNYPILLTSHIKIFDFLFGIKKEDMFPLVQLANSVVILDEIQSYRNFIWKEIMMFLEKYAKILNIKIIIMSATLPHLNKLTDAKSTYLINNREKYFSSKLFKNRVSIDYSLLKYGKDDIDDILFNKVEEVLDSPKEYTDKILVCFIKKTSANEFYNKCVNYYKNKDVKLYLITGDVSKFDRKKIITELKGLSKEEKVILVATQVVEAGVDIDMDVGFKDISILDSEEQFLGRINRSCKKYGCVAYFFNKDDASGIYRGDFRAKKEYTLLNEDMQKILADKNFESFYDLILKEVEQAKGDKSSIKHRLKVFVEETLNSLEFKDIKERMKLIDSPERITVFLNRKITLDDGTVMIGRDIWNEYKSIAKSKGKYAKKCIDLSIIMEKVDCFTYRMSKWENSFDDAIGDMIYVEDGEKYFVNGIFDSTMVSANIEVM